MIELIGMLASLAVCILIPVQASKFRAGVYPKNDKFTPEQMLAAFRKQLAMFVWLGLGFGVLFIFLAVIEDEPGEWMVKLVGAALWFAAGGIAFFTQRSLPAAATPVPRA